MKSAFTPLEPAYPTASREDGRAASPPVGKCHVPCQFLTGFTLIEVLLTAAILVLLTSVILINLRPSTRFAEGNNLKRSSDVNSLLNAIHRYASDNKGALPAGIAGTAEISDSGADICSTLVPVYLSQLPVDPLTNSGQPISTCAGAYTTNYTVARNSNNTVTVAAPAAESGTTISATR